METVRDTFCSYCGTRFPAPLAYPRSCATCRTQIWSNPIPVCVVLVPIVDGDRGGLLVIRRAIQPGLGKLALVGGFLEEHETWQHGGAREVREETGVIVDPATLVPHWFASSAPRPNRVQLFSIAPAQRADSLPSFTHNTETSERGVIYGPAGLDEVFAFATHVEATRRYFEPRGVTAHHGFTPR
jgi:ADP-ribose pyrophosphatase YjhB (NUDIX family)